MAASASRGEDEPAGTLTATTPRCLACLGPGRPSVSSGPGQGKGCPHGRCPVPARSPVRQPRGPGRRGLDRPRRGRAAAGLGVGAETSNDLSLPGTESQQATDLLTSRFPPQQNGSSPVVFHVTRGKITP